MTKVYYSVVIFLMTTTIALAWPNNTLDPKALEDKASVCDPLIDGKKVCSRLRHKSERLNRFAYELRVNPLKYGTKVLALQEKLKDPLASSKSNRQLKERLAVIKWLESPGR